MSSDSASKTTLKTSRARIVIRAVIFIILAFALFVYLNMAVMLKGTAQTKGAVDSFYNLQKNTVDVMYIGTSATSRYYVNPLAFHDYGLATYSIGINACPTYCVEDIMRESLATQDPDLFIIELRPSYKEAEEMSDTGVRRTIDSFNLFSPNRAVMATKALKYSSEAEGLGIADYLFPITKFHTRLINGELTLKDILLKTPENKMQGFHVSKVTLSTDEQTPGRFTDLVGKLSAGREDMLDNLLDYCDSLDKEVLFVMAPYSLSGGMAKALNGSAAYVESRGYPVLNCNDEQICADMGLDWSKDFYNNRHVNYMGAEKFTAYLSRYLQDHYNLPDRRGNDSYSAWEDGYEYYKGYTSDGIKYHHLSDEDAE